VAARRCGTDAGKLAATLLASSCDLTARLRPIAASPRAIAEQMMPRRTRAKKTARAPTGAKRYAREDAGTCVARTVSVDGAPMRLCLGPKMWSALKEIRARQGMTLTALMNDVARSYPGWPLESALGVYTLLYFMAAATEEGHRRAGHGASAGGYAVSDNSAPWFFQLLPNASPSKGGAAPDC